MIKHLIDMLQLSDWYGVSHNVDVAKGLYEGCSNWSDVVEQVKRVKESKAYRNGKRRNNNIGKSKRRCAGK